MGFWKLGSNKKPKKDANQTPGAPTTKMEIPSRTSFRFVSVCLTGRKPTRAIKYRCVLNAITMFICLFSAIFGGLAEMLLDLRLRTDGLTFTPRTLLKIQIYSRQSNLRRYVITPFLCVLFLFFLHSFSILIQSPSRSPRDIRLPDHTPSNSPKMKRKKNNIWGAVVQDQVRS